MNEADSWIASQPTIAANAGAMMASPGRPRPFRPGVLGPGARRLPRSPLIPYSGWGAATSAPPEVPPADVEAAAQVKEATGFTYLAAGGGGAVAGAVLKDLPLLVRVGLAGAGIVATILGVKNLAEAEATRQAGLKVGVVLAECMASKIIGGSKIPI
jgi:hypothetical protein